VSSFFTKWLATLNDSQKPDGEYPVVSPHVVASGAPCTACWADAGIICPWTINLVYDDTRIIERHWDNMERYMEALRKNAGDDLLRPAEGFGDWLSIEADTPKDVLATAYYANNARKMAQMAKAIGRTADDAKYLDLFKAIKAAFIKAYVAEDGRIKGNTQTCYVIALQFDLLPRNLRAKAEQYLVEDIKNRGWRLSTGFIGTKDLMQVLTNTGNADVAYRLFHQQAFPGWGFSIQQGATSIWERWDGWTPENGFQDPGMNSFAHYSFGAVYQWMVENLGGIHAAGPAYKAVRIAPVFDPKLTRCSVVYGSIRGTIASDWTRTPTGVKLTVTIPANTRAEVVLDLAANSRLTESGRPIEGEAGARADGRRVIAVGSGTYHFLFTPR
jgi:alpha-L-rhamnosidase